MAEEVKAEVKAKIGTGHASAMLRQGFHELQGALYTGSNVAQNPEYGTFGTKTPGEVADGRRGGVHGVQPDQEAAPQSSVLSERLKEADARASRAEREPPAKDQGLDRG